MKPPLYKQLGLPKPRPAYTPLKAGAKRVRKRPVQWEEQYTILVAEFFGWALPRDCVWYHVPNGGLRSKAQGAKLKAMGVKPGVHDFVLFWRGTYHELDLKWDASLSPEQKDHAKRVVAAGGKVGMARRTLEDVCRQLDEWGIPHANISGRPQAIRAHPGEPG